VRILGIVTGGLLLLAATLAGAAGGWHSVELPDALREGRAHRVLLEIARVAMEEPAPTTFRVLGSLAPGQPTTWQVLGTFSYVPISRNGPPDVRRFVVDLSQTLPGLVKHSGVRVVTIGVEAVREPGSGLPTRFVIEGLSLRVD
jgi:hypothetical protein